MSEKEWKKKAEKIILTSKYYKRTIYADGGKACQELVLEVAKALQLASEEATLRERKRCLRIV